MQPASSPPQQDQTEPAPETGPVVRELIAELTVIEQRLRAATGATMDEQTLLESYKWLFSILHVGLLGHVWADKVRPRFVDIVGPYLKWGGDNSDAFYQLAPVDPDRTYRVTGHLGDAVYASVTVYGGPDDGRYSDHIVGMVNDRDFRPVTAEDGTFSFWMSPREQEGPGILLTPGAVFALTRDYLIDPERGRRAEWKIEAIDEASVAAAPKRDTDADLARRFRAALIWLRQQSAMVPIPLGEPNSIDEPYPVPTVTFGWAAGDAAYAMGSFELGADEALVIEGRSPECVFWNLCCWNQLLHTYDYAYERVTLNGGQLQYEPDGSWRIVVSAFDPGHPNWLSTAGHQRGRLWFRWFLPEATPSRPTTRVVPVTDAAA